MKATEQTLQQIDRMLRKVEEKFPKTKESGQLTDLHLRITQDTGEMVVFDDDDNEITRCVIEQWIDNKDDSFYHDIAITLKSMLNKHKKAIEALPILKPYSFVMENDEHEHLEELYLVDDDTVIIDQELMGGLDKDLDDFLAQLLKE